ncbi:Saposin B-type domain-containing protein [Caenorhabditis elegans]|uniref:Saposin B-type domain-containing protein n=1 Tax=Caenorhabditis elegans TaxID=6239 RepID=Q94255_CAEEL|nr:Saposin B-type domain-containing protein [Caenorhabditis elegans]CCD68858.2 Saposin B-type domain-containing protein [Caenorhabditis elegans]|eukprot:NP_001343652.1 SaPosin-like Protein family [Caenorhabditis elegans]
MNNFVTFILVQFLFTIGFSTPLSTELPSSNCKMFCELCQDGFSLIHKNIEQFESVTNEEIVKFIDHICQLAPKLDIINVVCEVAKNDMIDGVNKFLDFLKNNTDPVVACTRLSIC